MGVEVNVESKNREQNLTEEVVKKDSHRKAAFET
jgi:hypothetical protein